jgi:hypothetical protein
MVFMRFINSESAYVFISFFVCITQDLADPAEEKKGERQAEWQSCGKRGFERG